MVKFSAATRLFSDGHVGNALVSELHLPHGILPEESTWNQFPSLSEEERMLLAQSTFASPHPTGGGKQTPLESISNHLKKQQFLSLNAGAVRFSPTHRIWDSDDILAAHQRWSFGCSLMVLRCTLPSGDVSEPFLVIVGPTGTVPANPSLDTRELYGLSTPDDLPRASDGSSLPEIIAPTIMSLSSSSRDWVNKTKPEHLLAALPDAGQLITLLDSRRLHSTVCVFDASDSLATRINGQPDILHWEIWAPVQADSNGAVDVSQDLADSWLTSAELPPHPHTSAKWSPADYTARPETDSTKYSPALLDDMVFLCADDSPISDTASCILLPRFLRFPHSVFLPVGLVMRPAAMDLPKLRELVALCGKDSSMHNTTWMANGILETWLAAAAKDPAAFAVTVQPQNQLTDIMSRSASSKMADIRLFLEWSMLSQFLWDQAFAASSVSRGSGTTNTLVRYSKALVDAYNNQAHDSAVSIKWGHVSSVYRSPFLAMWRPLPDEVISTAAPPFAAFSLATPNEIPKGASSVPAIPVGLNHITRGEISCDPICFANHDRNPSPREQQVLEQPLAISIQRVNPFRARGPTVDSPPKPAKRTKFDDLFSINAARPVLPGHLATRIDQLEFSLPEQQVIFDPDSFAKPSSVHDDTWRLPAFLPGRLMPIHTIHASSGHSAALLTAIRQSTLSHTSKTNSSSTQSSDTSVTYEFSLELMQQQGPTRATVNAAAYWGSFRLALAGDAPIHTLDLPQRVFHSDYLFAPGRLGPELASMFKAAHQKVATTPAVAALCDWFTEQCSDGEMNSTDSLPCRFQPNFFTPSIIQALQNFAFKSGLNQRSSTPSSTILTPWHFIPSIPALASAAPKIPAGGMLARHVADIVGNIFYIIHLLFRDFRDFPALGYQHSPFSRFSPLAGHLLLLMDKFRNRPFEEYWDNLPSLTKEQLTTAVFVAIAELFRLYETWLSPKSEVSSTFRVAQVASHSDLILLSPSIDRDGSRHTPFLSDWRSRIEIFSPQRLRNTLPHDGFFSNTTPPCFLSTPADTHIPPRSVAFPAGPPPSVTYDSQSTIASGPSLRTQPTVSATPGPPAPTSRPQASGESNRRLRKARVPLVMRVDPGFVKPFGTLLRELNTHRSATEQIKVPSCVVPATRSPRSRPICFRFASTESDGCPGRCNFLHIDLDQPAWIREHIPRQFLLDYVSLLEHPSIKPHFKPTPELRSFLGLR
jgi:hypothetical protein